MKNTLIHYRSQEYPRWWPILSILVLASLFLGSPSSLTAQVGTAFLYQGQLLEDDEPGSGVKDFQFTLYDARENGRAVSLAITNLDVRVENGLFTTTLDFGSRVFEGDARWLEIGVREARSGSPFVGLRPRQPIQPAPYAIFADSALVATRSSTANSATFASRVPWSGLTGVPAGFDDAEDNDTTYSAGNGLNLNGTMFEAQGSGFANVIVVAKSGGDFTTIDGALNSISDAGPDNPYLIWVAPGQYLESVQLKSHVHLQGAGRDAVILEGEMSDATRHGDVAVLEMAGFSSVRDMTILNTGTGTYNAAVTSPNSHQEAVLSRVKLMSRNATISHGLLLRSGARVVMAASEIDVGPTTTDAFGIYCPSSTYTNAVLHLNDVLVKASGEDDAFGIYVVGTTEIPSRMEAYQVRVTALGSDDSHGLYLSNAEAFVEGGTYIARAMDTGATDTYGIRSFTSELTAIGVTALGEGARFYNYGIDNFGTATLRGGSYTGRGGTGGSNVNAAVGVHNRGPMVAIGIEGIGTGHASRNQGLDNEGGNLKLVGGRFHGEGGLTTYGIENFGTGSTLTAQGVEATALYGSSGAYGFYNGGEAKVNSCTFEATQGGPVFGTYGIYNVFSVGRLEATGVTATGRDGTNEVWGLRNWIGEVTLNGGSFTAVGGTNAYGIDIDTTNASLKANGISVVARDAVEINYGLFNQSTADSVLEGGSFVASGGSVSAVAIFNLGSGSTIIADHVTATASGSVLDIGWRNSNSAVSELTASKLTGSSLNALYMTSGTVRIGVSQLDGGATRQSGTLTCFQNYDGSFAPLSCP